MENRERFKKVFEIPEGMLKSDPLKDDPRYRGGRIPRPDIGEDIVLRPNIVMLIPRVVVWVLVFYLMRGEEMLGPAGGKWFLEGLCVLDAIFAVPKFLFEHTIIRQKGIERSVLGIGKLFPWEDFHKLERDFLGLSLRTKPGWGIWRDEFSLIISWLYYSPAAINGVWELFRHKGAGKGDGTKGDEGGLIDFGVKGF